ncbi:hypothetical protein [Alteromonas antoniana]|nr:hypothetical protein [Alteromonas antoniana]
MARKEMADGFESKKQNLQASQLLLSKNIAANAKSGLTLKKKIF